MFKIIMHLLVLLNLCIDSCAYGNTANTYDSIDYNIRFNPEYTYLHMKAKYNGNFSKNIAIDLPYKWAGAEYYSQIRNIGVMEENNFSINSDKENQLLINLITPRKSIEIDYEIHPNVNQKFDVQEAIISTDLVHTPGYGIFATPEDIISTAKININITWEGMPKEWKVLSSHGLGRTLNFSSNIPDLLHSIFLAGKVRKYQTSIKNKKVLLSLYGNFDFEDNKIQDLIFKVIESQRDFFQDYDFKDYMVSVIEQKASNDTKMAFMGGISLYNSFAFHTTKNIDFKLYKTLFAHEHLHTWICNKIQNSEEALNFWWSEGFTDYYSKVLAVRSGVFDFYHFIDEINLILKDYYTSPVVNINNNELSQGFWQNVDIQKISYLRGAVFALYLNSKIKLINKRWSIDKILVDFFSLNKTTLFSNGEFVRLFTNYDNSFYKFEELFSRHIIEGKTIYLDSCMSLLPMYKVFDPKKSFMNLYYYQLKTKLSDADIKQIKAFFDID
jgi:predicted metalloprotease with PDZ domain